MYIAALQMNKIQRVNCLYEDESVKCSYSTLSIISVGKETCCSGKDTCQPSLSLYYDAGDPCKLACLLLTMFAAYHVSLAVSKRQRYLCINVLDAYLTMFSILTWLLMADNHLALLTFD